MALPGTWNRDKVTLSANRKQISAIMRVSLHCKSAEAWNESRSSSTEWKADIN
jgi:hypothetical protein